MTSREIKFDNSATCNNKSPLCPLNSKCYSLDPAVCICNEWYVFSRKTKRCTKGRLVAIKGIHHNLEWNGNYFDTSSIAFYKIAVKNGDFTANNADEDIQGVKIIGAGKGSVVLDGDITAETTTPKLRQRLSEHQSFIGCLISDRIRLPRSYTKSHRTTMTCRKSYYWQLLLHFRW